MTDNSSAAPHLFSQLTLRSLSLRNRIGVSPMCMYSSDDGAANDWHLVHLGSRAVGGAGLIIAEATAVEARGRITPNDAGLWDDAHIGPLRRVTAFQKAHGAIPGVQLAHAGRKASHARPWAPRRGLLMPGADGGWQRIAPSPIPFREGDPPAREMTPDDIAAVQRAFANATTRALAAGYEFLELHSAHGYLCHSFLSPISNQRTDAYGGSFDNRIRFVVETARLMRARWPDHLPLAVRISCTDWADDGWTLDESVALARILRAEGVDMIDCSSGGSRLGVSVEATPGFQVPFAERIRREAGIPTAAVGAITDPRHADQIIQEGRADVVLLARQSLRDPYWPMNASRVLRPDPPLRFPHQYDAFIGIE